MVAFKGSQGQNICAQPPETVKALLIYGPNAGLIRERANGAVAFAVEDLTDAFRLCELQARDIADAPARLADELAALSFGGGRRSVWLKDAGDSHTSIVSAALETECGDTLLVVEAANLGPRSSLRKLFEQGAELGAVPCYDDDQNSLQNYVSEFLAGEKVTIDPDALYWLLDRLGNDRMQVRSELEKLVLYVSGDDIAAGDGGGRITLKSAMDGAGDAGVWSLDQLADAVAGGELANVDRFLELALEQGAQPISAMRSVARRFLQLHYVVGLAADGGSVDKLIAALRPPIFFKNRQAFRNQATHWSVPRIAQALDILCQAEIDCKTTGMPAHEISARALVRIGAAARAGRGRG